MRGDGLHPAIALLSSGVQVEAHRLPSSSCFPRSYGFPPGCNALRLASLLKRGKAQDTCHLHLIIPDVGFFCSWDDLCLAFGNTTCPPLSKPDRTDHQAYI